MKMNILVVEDEAMIRELVVMMLEMDGHTVSEASNADEALSLLIARSFDLVITDNDMPLNGKLTVDQGLEVIKEAKSLPNPPQVIWMSARASGDPELMDRARSVGADDILAKPFYNEEFRRTISRIQVNHTLDTVPV